MQTFDLYRYQLLPSSQQQRQLFDKLLSADEIREKKNEFFSDVIQKLPNFDHRTSAIKHKLVSHQGDLFIYKIGIHKSIDRDTEDFNKEKIENWPNVTLVINNNPESQIIAISRNKKAFSSTRSVVNLLEKAITPALNYYGLTVQINELFEKNNFWSLIEEYKGQISKVRFEMIAPNMANISKYLKVDLKQLNKDSNCHKANIELESLPNSHLEINRENELIDGCVEYSSQGGGDIVLKINGFRHEIRTSKSIKTVEIDEITVQNPSGDLLTSLNNIFK